MFVVYVNAIYKAGVFQEVTGTNYYPNNNSLESNALYYRENMQGM